MKVVGVTLGWSMRPQLAWEREVKWLFFRWKQIRVAPYEFEYKFFNKYYPDGYGSWPKDPITGEKLEIV